MSDFEQAPLDWSDLEQKTLDWVNGIRTSLGHRPLKELLKGKRAGTATCPVAMSLKVCADRFMYVDGWKVSFMRQRKFHKWNTPDPVRRFIRLFDGGHLPRYIR